MQDSVTTPPDFSALFGRQPDCAAEAPGRVNLIGEHTDTSGGYVLPLAIPRRTRIEIAARDDDLVRAWSANVASSEGGGIEQVRLGAESRGRGWFDYVQGVGDLPQLERLLAASHRSLAEDFAVSTPEIDLLVALARREETVVGARLTGGGFGGAVLMLTRRGSARTAAQRVLAAYAWQSGRAGALLLP
ncbi:MAG TPA: galactokinase family protein [Thermoanaerobaculia bacterium]|nr:galactokinase family protein [Thermoanaerobaculia bacterium]